MWKTFKFYFALLCMCAACMVPAAMLTLPEEQIGLPGAFLVFGAGGGLLYALGSLYFESYTDRWEIGQEKTSKILSLIFSGIALLTQILLSVFYKSNTSGFVHLFMEFKGDLGELCLRTLSILSSGLAVFSIYTIAIGEVDTSEYLYTKTTYLDGIEYKKEYVTQSPTESKVSVFFITILVACAGIMSNCLSLTLFILLFNLGSLFNNKGKLIFTLTGVLSALTILIIESIVVFQNGDSVGFGLTINLTLTLMPVIYALLMFLYFIGYFNIEWLSGPVGLLIGCFVSIFIAYIASFGLSSLRIFLISLI